MRIKILTVLAIGGGLAACALNQLPGVTDPQMQALAHRALHNQEAQAQLELGIRYEYGRGVPMNWKYAERLYRTASADFKGTFSTPGSMFTFGSGTYRHGLPEAKARLIALRTKIAAAGRR